MTTLPIHGWRVVRRVLGPKGRRDGVGLASGAKMLDATEDARNALSVKNLLSWRRHICIRQRWKGRDTL